MKHIIHKLLSIIKKVFFFFRVIVTLEIGKSDGNDEILSQRDSGKENTDENDIK